MLVMHQQTQDRQIAWFVGLALLVITYIAFSIRSQLNLTVYGDLLSFKRLIATVTGAIVFWLIVNSGVLRGAERISTQIAKFLLIGFVAACVIFSIRVGYDLAFFEQPQIAAVDNARWIIVWLGYFMAAIFGFLAISSSDHAARKGAQESSQHAPLKASQILTEVVNWSQDQQRSLIGALQRRSVYEEADPIAVSTVDIG